MANDLPVAFGRRLRLLRVDRGWSQEKLAEKSGVHPNFVGLVERGERSPSLVNVGRLAVGLGLSLDELFAGIVYEDRRRKWSYRLVRARR